MSNPPKILIYDIETAPLQAWIWRCGEQRVNPSQLVEGKDRYDIICLAYAWLDSNEKGVLDWNFKKQDSKPMVKEFTEMCDYADMIIGKNNKRFDDKHINTMRLIHGLDGRPDLMSKVDDLEVQMRKHFYLPSNGLDYFSKILGFGGKSPVGFEDWINIVTKHPTKGEAALKKMKKYCLKDVLDTKNIWNYCRKHIKPRYNYSKEQQKGLVCANCGSVWTRKNGTITTNGKQYQNMYCNEHGGHAGRYLIGGKTKILGV